MRAMRFAVVLLLVLLPQLASGVPVKVRWVAEATLSDGTPAGASGDLGEYDISLGNEVFLLPLSAGFTARIFVAFLFNGTVPLYGNSGVALVFTSPTTAKFARFNGSTGALSYGAPGSDARVVILPRLHGDLLLGYSGSSQTPLVTTPVRIELEFPEGPPIPPCTAIDAVDDEYTVINDGSPATLPVLENEVCDDDGPIGIFAQGEDLMPDRGGSASSDGTEVLYTPAPGFVGFEEFTYSVEDAGAFGGLGTPAVDVDSARVVVDVIQDLVPEAVDDVVSTIPSMPKSIEVLANDAIGNGPVTLEIATPPSFGSAQLHYGDTRIFYTPDPDFIGEDAFEYRITDANGDESTATIVVRVFFGSGEIPIDVVPGDPGNTIDPNAWILGRFQVAILSSGEFFDAPAVIDPLSLKIGPRQATAFGYGSASDVDGDGDLDLVVQFLTHQTGLECGDIELALTGRTFLGQAVFGQSFVQTAPCP